MNRLFITGTGTGVGKTWVTSALSHQLLEAGLRVRAVKPLATGTPLRPDDDLVDESFADSDAYRLALAQSQTPTRSMLNAINAINLPDALSPDMAAARVLRTLTVDELLPACLATHEEYLLIEGIGGAFVPLSHQETVLDWLLALQCPAVIVAGAYLGTLSHTLSTIEALLRNGVEVSGLVVTECEPGPVVIEETIASLRPHLGDLPIVALPHATSFREAPDLRVVLPPSWR